MACGSAPRWGNFDAAVFRVRFPVYSFCLGFT